MCIVKRWSSATKSRAFAENAGDPTLISSLLIPDSSLLFNLLRPKLTIDKPNMASNPPAACCTVGVKHEGEAKGQFQQIGDGIETVPTYSNPSQK